jgi:hypothetical protein
LQDYNRADELVQAGRAAELLDVKLPLPFVITAGGYVEKYGPDERYDFVRFAGSAPCPTLITFGGVEIEKNVAFRGVPEALEAVTARHPHVRVETVPGADHFYSGVRDDLIGRVETWLRAALT